MMAPAPYSEPAAYYTPRIGRMSGIEVLKGSSQVRFGPHTTGGVVNYLSTPFAELDPEIPAEPASGKGVVRMGTASLGAVGGVGFGKPVQRQRTQRARVQLHLQVRVVSVGGEPSSSSQDVSASVTAA